MFNMEFERASNEKAHTIEASCTSAAMAQPQQACVTKKTDFTWPNASYEVLHFREDIRLQV